MSDTSRWVYTNKATVWPLLQEQDGWSDSAAVYGEPYLIDCSWAGGGKKVADRQGNEFVPKITFWHEDKRVKYGDWIARGEQTDRLLGDPIRSHVEYDMSFFGENPDYVSMVG